VRLATQIKQQTERQPVQGLSEYEAQLKHILAPLAEKARRHAAAYMGAAPEDDDDEARHAPLPEVLESCFPAATMCRYCVPVACTPCWLGCLLRVQARLGGGGGWGSATGGLSGGCP